MSDGPIAHSDGIQYLASRAAPLGGLCSGESWHISVVALQPIGYMHSMITTQLKSLPSGTHGSATFAKTPLQRTASCRTSHLRGRRYVPLDYHSCMMSIAHDISPFLPALEREPHRYPRSFQDVQHHEAQVRGVATQDGCSGVIVLGTASKTNHNTSLLLAPHVKHLRRAYLRPHTLLSLDWMSTRGSLSQGD